MPPRDAGPESILTPDVDVAAPPAAAAPDERGAEANGAGAGAAPEPNIRRIGAAMRQGGGIRAFAVTGLFVLALFYTLFLARAFFLPIVFAVLLDFLLSPLIRLLGRARIPPPLGAAVVIVALVGALAVLIVGLAEPARGWAARAPGSMAEVSAKLRTIRQPVEEVTKTAEKVAEATGQATGGPADASAPEVVVRGPSMSARVLGTVRDVALGFAETLILLYFLLAAGDLFLQKLIKVLPQLRDKKKAVRIAREVEASVSTYLFTVTLVNMGLGLAVYGVMWALGMPNPILWGVLAGAAEFVPYLGAAVMIVVLGFAALSTFDSVGYALLVPLSYFAVNFVQANFIYPVVLGRRLTLNPVAVFVGLMFWWKLWGIPGAFIAVPLVATFKIFCDHIETLAPVGEFLGK